MVVLADGRSFSVLSMAVLVVSEQGGFWLIKSDTQKAAAAAHIATIKISHDEPYAVTIKPYKHDRRPAQNRLSHMWYSEVSEQGNEYTPEEVKSIAKLRWGVPILLAESAEFAKFWALATATNPSYEDRWKIIMPCTPVTSLMSTKQMARYLTDFQRVMGSKYNLTDPALMGLE